MTLTEYSKEWIKITTLSMCIVVMIIVMILIIYTFYLYYVKDYSKKGEKEWLTKIGISGNMKIYI